MLEMRRGQRNRHFQVSKAIFMDMKARSTVGHREAARWYFETSSDQAINKSRNRARTIQLQNAELFGRFFERLPTGGDARHKGLARLAL
jgi:hypothetical protein